MLRRFSALAAAGAVALVALVVAGGAAANPNSDANKLRTIGHIVVIYEENHSFDNLYGGWEGVRGLADADAGAHDAARPDRARAASRRTSASTRTTPTCRRSRRPTRRLR